MFLRSRDYEATGHDEWTLIPRPDMSSMEIAFAEPGTKYQKQIKALMEGSLSDVGTIKEQLSLL